MTTRAKWDTAYEKKAVTLLGLGFGLVGLDRWIIAPLFPAMMKDLKLSYQDLGNLVGILGLSWGVFAVIMGGLSDRIGRRKGTDSGNSRILDPFRILRFCNRHDKPVGHPLPNGRDGGLVLSNQLCRHQ